MITQNLIDLIHSGKGKYSNWATGITGSQRIPVPRNNYIVITDFTFYNFMDRGALAPDHNLQEPFKRCIHNLKFKSYGNEFIYIHRSNFIIQNNPAVSNQKSIFMPLTNFDKYDTYQVHKTDCHIDIWSLNDTQSNVSTFQRLQDTTTEDPGPQGYGTFPGGTPATNVVVQTILGAPGGPQFLPYGNLSGITQLPGWRENLRADIDATTGIQPPKLSEIEAPFTFPLLNIGYVLVNEPFEKNNR